MVAKGPSPNASSVEKTINNITKPTKTNKGLHWYELVMTSHHNIDATLVILEENPF